MLVCLPVLQKHAVEHGEDDLLLGLGEAANALELTLELGGGPALPVGGPRAGNPEQHIRGHAEERGELGDEHDGEAQAADLVMRERLLRDAQVCGHRLLREAGVLGSGGHGAALRERVRRSLRERASERPGC